MSVLVPKHQHKINNKQCIHTEQGKQYFIKLTDTLKELTNERRVSHKHFSARW